MRSSLQLVSSVSPLISTMVSWNLRCFYPSQSFIYAKHFLVLKRLIRSLLLTKILWFTWNSNSIQYVTLPTLTLPSSYPLSPTPPSEPKECAFLLFPCLKFKSIEPLVAKSKQVSTTLCSQRTSDSPFILVFCTIIIGLHVGPLIEEGEKFFLHVLPIEFSTQMFRAWISIEEPLYSRLYWIRKVRSLSSNIYHWLMRLRNSQSYFRNELKACTTLHNFFLKTLKFNVSI